MKTLLKLLAALLVVVGVITIYGATLPLRHLAVSHARFHQKPEALWAVISDFPAMGSWRSGVSGVERMPDRDGMPVWLVHSSDGSMPLQVSESEPPTWLKTVIPADANLAFGGSWSWQISPAEEATIVTIIEEGEIYNQLFRALAKLFFGYHDSINATLVDLGRKFGEEVEPKPVPQAVPAN
jgi:hypothetical protein